MFDCKYMYVMLRKNNTFFKQKKKFSSKYRTYYLFKYTENIFP